MWVSGWVDQKLVWRPGWTRGGLANTDSLYRKDYTQTVGKVQSGIKWNYWHERRRCSPSQLGNDWQWRIYSSLQYGHCWQSWLSSTTLRLNSFLGSVPASIHGFVGGWVSGWVGEWVDQKLFARRPGWTRGGLANTASLYRTYYTQILGTGLSGRK